MYHGVSNRFSRGCVTPVLDVLMLTGCPQFVCPCTCHNVALFILGNFSAQFACVWSLLPDEPISTGDNQVGRVTYMVIDLLTLVRVSMSLCLTLRLFALCSWYVCLFLCMLSVFMGPCFCLCTCALFGHMYFMSFTAPSLAFSICTVSFGPMSYVYVNVCLCDDTFLILCE